MQTLLRWLVMTTPASYIHRNVDSNITDGSLFAWSLITATTGTRWIRAVR